MRPLAPLALLLVLIPAPGASAATCTANASGPWTTSGTWSCHAVPGAADAVVIPAGKTVSLADDADQSAASVTLKGGALALGDSSELDAGDFAAIGGGTISGPQYALLTVDLPAGVQATIDAGGLGVDGAYVDMTGDGTFGVAGPLALSDGGWLESDVDTTWSGSAPWQLGGGTGTPPPSGFEMVGGQLTIIGATAAQQVAGGGAGVIEIDGGATLYKQDATTTALGVGVLLDIAEIHVLAGKLIGSFQGSGELNVSSGATLGLAGSDVQLAAPAIDLAGSVEAEPGSNVALSLPSAPALRRIGVLAGASLDVSVDGGSGPVDTPAAPDDLAKEIVIGTGATLSIDGGGGILGLSDGETLSGAGELDGTLVNAAGTAAPNGTLHLTGDYTQAAAGTLALDLRGDGDGDSLQVDGAVHLDGTLRVATAYSPAPSATPLVLASAAKPAGTFAKTLAPISATRSWTPAYGAAGVTLAIGAAGAYGGGAPISLTAPSLRAVPVVGGRTLCLPGSWKGAHALAYQWLRGGKPIAKATAARYLVAPADAGRALSCRVTATATDGSSAAATSKRARAVRGLAIVGVSADAGGVAVTLKCTRSERRCSGSLRVLVGGRAIAQGHFSVRAPGGVVHLDGIATGDVAVVVIAYRNRAGAARNVLKHAALRR